VRRPAVASDPLQLDAPETVAALARDLIPDDGREHFVALYLNTKNRLVAAHVVAIGTLSSALVHPREVFGPALRIIGIAALVLVHNHPSGDPTPSRDDVSLTTKLVEAGRLLDVTVHDHVIIGSGTAAHVSMASRGLL
jgi:DNA repair protein RadC